MTQISKEEFMVILKRKQESGLSVKDFCENQSYTASSFYYWKSKFGLIRPYNNHSREAAISLIYPLVSSLGNIDIIK